MKNLITGVIAVLAILGALAFFGLTPFGKQVIQEVTAGSPTGSTFNTAKIAAIDMNFGSGTGSTTSILNTDSSGRWYSAGFADCTGLAQASTSIATFSVEAATTSVPNEGLQGNTNYLLNLNVATTSINGTVNSANSTTTGSDSATRGYWPAGTYLTFLVNAVSTTSACTVGINYIPS